MNRIHCRRLALILLLGLLTGLCGCNKSQGDATPQEDTVVTLAAVGDIYLTTPMLLDARTSSGASDFSALFAGVIPTLCAADVTLGNFEGSFAGSPYGPSEGSYPDELAAALSTAGFDLLQTANSFSIHNGMSGLERTRSILLGQQLIPLGTYATRDERKEEQAILLEIRGIRIAFVAFTKGLGGMSIPSGSEYSVNLLYKDYDSTYSKLDYDAIDQVLAAAHKLEPDVIVAALHWGSENVSEVSASQEELADYLFRNDVDLILGSHSHIPGRIEERSVTTGSGFEKTVAVAYSLGDFCAAESGEVAASLVLQVEFTRSADSGETTITGVSYAPIATADLGADQANRFAVLNIDDAVALYEGNYYARVSEEVYEALLEQKEALLKQVESREEP